METTTIEDVEIVTAGIEWPASTGPVTITMEHLADAVEAANNDPHVRAGRVKIGHDNVQLCGELGDHDPYWGGEPVFGSMDNLRLDNDGAVLVADLVNVPVWLAEAAPTMWPSRSMECVWDVTTEGGKHYSMVLTAIALLGAHLPAVSDLEDLVALATTGPALERSHMPTPTDASVDVDVVRRRFNFEWAMDPDNGAEQDTYWWWARSIRVDPMEIVADDDDGGLWLVSYETDGTDEVTFSEPQRVRETFVPVNASVGSQVKELTERAGQKVVAASLARPDDKPARKGEDNPAASRPDTEETTMPDIDMDALRTHLGVAEDADEEAINAALSAAAEEPEEDKPEGEPTPDPEETPEPTAASGDGPTVPIDREVLAQLQRDAAAGAAARDQQVAEHRESVLSAAVQAGKIAPASKSAWLTKLTREPEATEAELEALPSGLIPVGAEKGDGGATSADSDAYPDHWFPELREQPEGAATA